VIKNLSINVARGPTVAIVGATGSGKSTLLHLIAGLLMPDAGSIRVQRGGASIVFQDPFLFAESLRYNVTLDSEMGSDQISTALATAECTEFLEGMPNGLETVMGERGVSFSGGQRQRVALARAIAHDCPVLLLDDTTSALDPKTEANVINNLRKISSRRTLIIVASRPSTIALADEVLFLDDGQIVEQGSHNELLTRSEKYRLLISAFEHDRDDSKSRKL